MTARRPHLVVVVGMPGAGKTTFAHRLLARCPEMRLVSPDVIRDAWHPGYAQGRVDHAAINHRRIFSQAYRDTAQALAAGHDVLFDATSLTVARRQRLLVIARAANAIPIAHYFAITVPLALQRNNRRARRVPPGAIVNMARLLHPPTRDEGFARVVTHRQHDGTA